MTATELGNGASLAPRFDNDQAPTAESYKTSTDFGADYGLFGRIGNWFFGTNKAAEQAAGNWNARVSNKYNSDEAKKGRDWQEMMTSTQLQRMMDDARKAGVNPYYIAQKMGGSYEGGSAPTASSAATSPSTRSDKGSGNKVASLATTALALAKLAVILG